MTRPSLLFVDASVHLPKLTNALRLAMMESDPHDLHRLRDGAIAVELDYHLDNLTACLHTKDHAMMRLVEYWTELKKEPSTSEEVTTCVMELGLHLYDTLVLLGAYIKDSHFPYQYHSRLGEDGIAFMKRF
ncbi:MAG: hypothetical protein P4L77_11555 [Sulfuriferula sp.]|nr:hypothetical protein [Sulfuriferula sp.]